MQSTAKTVDEYMETVPDDRRAALERIRDLCQKHLKGYHEEMGYGMPGYTRNGVGEVGFNSQKQYISLYFTNLEVLNKYRHHFQDVGKSCIRYRNPAKIDFALMEQVLKDTAASNAEICP